MKTKDFDFEKFGFTRERRYIIAVSDGKFGGKGRFKGAFLDRDCGRTESVLDDNYKRGYTLQEAMNRLTDIALDYANSCGTGDFQWFDDDSIYDEREFIKEMFEDAITAEVEGMTDEEIAQEVAKRMSDAEVMKSCSCDWYEGEGLYYCQKLIYAPGDESFSEDVVSYFILAIDEVEKSYPYSGYLKELEEHYSFYKY